jgi:hypothetical protein
MITRVVVALIVAGLLAALGWKALEQRYAEGYKAGVADLDAKVRAEGEKVTAARAALSAAKAEAAASAVEAYRIEAAALKEKEDAETTARLADQQRTIGRLRGSLAAAGRGPVRPDPGDACGAEKLRAFDLDAQLRECQSVSVEVGEALAEARGIIAQDQAAARADAAMIRLAQRWAAAVQVGEAP